MEFAGWRIRATSRSYFTLWEGGHFRSATVPREPVPRGKGPKGNVYGQVND